MSAENPTPDFEIIYAMDDGPPTTIGAGSFEQAMHARAEGDRIDRATADFGAGDEMSPGAQHFYRSMGEAGGVIDATEAALADYASRTADSREALLARIRQTGEEIED